MSGFLMIQAFQRLQYPPQVSTTDRGKWIRGSLRIEATTTIHCSFFKSLISTSVEFPIVSKVCLLQACAVVVLMC